MKRWLYIKLVLVLMLIGSWGSVRGGYYYGLVDSFSFETLPVTCTKTTVNLTNIRIYIYSKTQAAVSFDFTLSSINTGVYNKGSYKQTFDFGKGPEFSGSYCGIANTTTIYFPYLTLNSSFGGKTISVNFKATAEGYQGSSTTFVSKTVTLNFENATSILNSNNNTNCFTDNLESTGRWLGDSYANGTLSIETPSSGSIKIQDIIPDDNFHFDFVFPNKSISDFFPNLTDNTMVTFRLKVPGVPTDKTFTRTIYKVVPLTITSITSSIVKDVACYGEEITLNSNVTSSNVNYSWSNGATMPNIKVKPQGGFYDLTLTLTRGSDRVCPTSVRKIVTDFPDFSANVNPSAQSACEDSFITLTAQPDNNNYDYTWSNGSKGKSIQVNRAGEYKVTLQPFNGCPSRTSNPRGSDFIFDKRIENEKIELSKSDGVICANGDNNISLTARATDEGSLSGYLWLGNNGNTQKITVSNAGDYTVIMYRGNCSKQITQKITKFDFTASIATPTQSVCDDGSKILVKTSINDNDAPQYKFEWIGASGLGDKNTATITKAGDYQVKITPPFNCPAKTSTSVQYNFDPPFTEVDVRYPSLKTRPVICGAPEEPSIVLTAYAKDLSDVKYAWNGPNNSSLGTTDKITVLDANAGEYKLSLSHVSGTCLVSKTISVVGSFTPQINTVSPADGRICNEKGNAVLLTATPNNTTDYTYQWFGGTDGTTDLKQNTNPLSIKQTGIYALTMTQLGGNCVPKKVIKTVAVTVDEPILNAKISPDSAVICNPVSGLSLVASADGADVKYQWAGASSTSPTLIVKKQGDYFVTYTRGKCVIPNKKITAVESKLIVKLTPETASLSKPFIICTSSTNGVAFPLQASTNISGSSLKWYLTGTTDFLDTNKTYNPKKTGEYYAVATNSKFGCISDQSNKVNVTVFNNFSVNIDPLNPKELCEGSIQKFTAVSTNQNFDYSYVWSVDGNTITPSNTNFIDVKKEGNYAVAISKDGCKASSVSSKLSTKPSRPIITVLDNAFLESTDNVDGATGYQWYYKKANPVSENDTIVSAYTLLSDNTKQISIRIEEGTYIVKSNRNGCGKRFSNAIYLPKPLGIDFLDNKEWKIYPNPATEMINIENNSPIQDKARIDLWSNTGTLISSWIQSGKMSSYNFLSLPSGAYLITISQKEKSLTTKLIKQ